MQNNTLPRVINTGFLDQWSAISRIKKPIIAAVNGFAVSLREPMQSIFTYCYSTVRWWL